METNLFEKLKRTPLISSQNIKAIQAIFFVIDFDEYGAFLSVVDSKNKPVETDYRLYNGRIREVLRNLESIRDREAFNINWEKDEENIYLAEHDYLMWQLKYCDNLIDGQGQKLQFQEKERHLKLKIGLDKEEKNFQAQFYIKDQGPIMTSGRALTENYYLIQEGIVPILSIGNNFQNLNLFEGDFEIENLEKYLSLFFSFFQNIELEYKDYQVLYPKDQIEPQPSLFFEKVDPENSLFMRVSQVLPGFDYDFLDNYDVSQIAVINDLEENISVKNIHYEPLQDIIDGLKKMISSRKTALFQDENLLIIPENLALNFIRKDLSQLLTKFQLFGSEKLKSYRITAAQPQLNIKFASGIDFLGGEIKVEIEGEKFDLFKMIKEYNTQKYIQLTDGTQAILNSKYVRKLERIFKKGPNDQVKISFFDLPEIEELIAEKTQNQVFKRSRKVFEGFNTLKNKQLKLPSKLKAELRPYQKQGLKWLRYLYEQKLGACLADDMGLGKTLQTIALLSYLYPKEKSPSLIIMPRSLLFNWEKEIEKFNSSLSYYTYYSQNRDLEKAGEANLIFITYATLRNDIEKFRKKEFAYIILDESQNIKNVNSQTSKAIMLLKGKHRLALSGTPIENNLSELYSLFRFLNPSMFGSLDDFNRHYTLPIQQENSKEIAYELRRKIYPFILRRLKKNVLKDLPPKVEQILYVEMNAAQKKLYEERRAFYHQTLRKQIDQEGIKKSQFFILQALTELRQIASVPESKSEGKVSSAKKEVLIENILEATSNGHKCLIFATFLNAIESIGEELQKQGIHYVSMTGATRKRQELVDQFQNDKSCQVFLMTLKTGGVGLNLTAADMVYIYDPWWNIAAENQAIDRTHRIGQKQSVFTYKLIARESIEEKILELQEQKKELFDNIIASDSASIKSLSEADIDFVLG